MHKYNAKKAEADGFTFDSIAERDRYLFLKNLQLAGEIQGLQMQVRFRICDKFRRNGKAYLQANYISDFVYFENNKQVAEDVKGVTTAIYMLKRKLVLHKYPDLIFREVRRKGTAWEVIEF